MEEKTIKRYIAKDESGDVFIHTTHPNIFKGFDMKNNVVHFWSCDGEEDAVIKYESVTTLGHILGLDTDEWIARFTSMNWIDEPIEINIDLHI